jgi:hypothetical protein
VRTTMQTDCTSWVQLSPIFPAILPLRPYDGEGASSSCPRSAIVMRLLLRTNTPVRDLLREPAVATSVRSDGPGVTEYGGVAADGA